MFLRACRQEVAVSLTTIPGQVYFTITSLVGTHNCSNKNWHHCVAVVWGWQWGGGWVVAVLTFLWCRQAGSQVAEAGGRRTHTVQLVIKVPHPIRTHRWHNAQPARL